MIDDPVVEKLLEECGGSLDKLMDRLEAREEEDRLRLVSDVAEIRSRAQAESALLRAWTSGAG